MKSILLIALLACAPVMGHAQNGGTVSGMVRDQKGNPVEAVQVFLTGPTAGHSSQTNANGVFSFQNVPPGQYQVTAAAFQAVFPGTTDAARAIVILSNSPNGRGFALLNGAPPNGTHFPTAVAVTAEGVVGNVNLVLAAEPNPIDPSVKTIPGKIVVEGDGRATLSMGQLSLFFSDGPGNRGTNLTFLDKPSVVATTRIEPRMLRQTLDLVNTVMPLPRTPDGAFHLYLREGVYRVIQTAPPAGVQPTRSAGTALYYIKGLSFGATNLMKELMTLKGPTTDDLVITLAKCTPETKDEPLCR